MHLIFLEFPEQIEASLDAVPGWEPFLIVALTPHVARQLKAQDTPFSILEDFFDWRALEDEGGVALRRIDRLAARIDQALRDHVPLFAARAFTPGAFSSHLLRWTYGNPWGCLYQIGHVLKAVKPSFVIFSSTPEGEPTEDLEFLDESLYGRAISALCRAWGVPHRALEVDIHALSWWHPLSEPSLPSPEPLPAASAAPSPRPSVWSRAPGAEARRVLQDDLSKLKQRARLCLEDARLRRSGRRRARILVMAPSPLPESAFGGEADLCVWSFEDWKDLDAPKPNSDSLEAAWKAFLDDPERRELFTIWDVDWFELVENRFHYLMTTLSCLWLEHFFAAERALVSFRPDAALALFLSGPAHRAFAHAARRNGVPVVCVPHAPLGHVRSENHNMDLLFCDHYFASGGKTAAFMKQDFKGLSVEYHVAGCAIIDRLRRRPSSEKQAAMREKAFARLGLDPNKPTAMFVLNLVMWNHLYFYYNMRDDRRSFNIQMGVIDVFRKHPNAQVILKGHPSLVRPESPAFQYARDHLRERAACVTRRPFQDMIDLCDCYILDYPYTTLYQTLTRDKRIYAFYDFYEKNDFVFDLLKEEDVDFDVSSDALLRRLNGDLGDGRAFEKRVGTGRFLKSFADPFGDGRTEERAANLVTQIARAR